MRGKYCNLRASIVYRNRRVNRYCIHIILRPFSTRFSVRCHQVACIIVSTFHRNRNLCHRLRTADNCLNRRLKPHDSIFIAHIMPHFTSDGCAYTYISILVCALFKRNSVALAEILSVKTILSASIKGSPF